jgi:alpha-galactosidase
LTELLLVEVVRDGNALTIVARDEQAQLTVTLRLELADSGLLRLRSSLRNDGTSPYDIQQIGAVLPLPDRAVELLDLTGRWLRERHPQRHPFVSGTFARESRHGRTGHDATLVLAAGTAGFANRSGEVWAVHLGWSGDSVHWAERGPALTASLGTAELLAPGEVALAAGEEHRTPWTYAAYSAAGLDGIAAAFHGWLRSRPSHPVRPRPVVLNTWEAVYFDHDLDRLTRLADLAARLGVERFVLDDGWFRGRRDDTRGLGDWYVDDAVWPNGLTPLIDHVRGLGMDFGLWVEPEMVNPDSDLARAHPEWVLGRPGRSAPWRHQEVLDLTAPAAWEHMLARLDALLTENRIDYLKWDHNRDLVDAVDAVGRPAVHRQTEAVYRLLDALRARHPEVEIESCSSGGGRVDLGILQRTDRVWASDTNDALERQTIQRWTGLLLPPELIGAHVGPPAAHTTGRSLGLGLRMATALFGSFGVEWDISAASPEELRVLADGVETYKRLRALLHTGRVVNADLPDPSARLHGVVSTDGTHAVFAYVQLTTSAREVPAMTQLPGLDPGRTYLVRPLVMGVAARGVAARRPPWWDSGELRLSGRALGAVGVRLPVVNPAEALLLEVTAE